MTNEGKCVNVNIIELFMSRKKRNRIKGDCEEGQQRDMKLNSYFIELCEAPYITPFSLEPDPLSPLTFGNRNATYRAWPRGYGL